MGREAQKRVRKRFLWPNVARQYIGLYHSLVPAGAAGVEAETEAEDATSAARRREVVAA